MRQASSILFGCTIVFFTKFGSFLAVTMLTSLLVSTLFFMALLALIGPSDPHQQGSVRGAAQGLQQLVLGLGK